MIASGPFVPFHSFGAQLRSMRIEAGLSLRQTAKGAGISPSFLSDIEFNRRMPSRQHLKKLAQAVGRPESDLLRYDNRTKLEELFGCLTARGELIDPLIWICRGVEAGSLTVGVLQQFAAAAKRGD